MFLATVAVLTCWSLLTHCQVVTARHCGVTTMQAVSMASGGAGSVYMRSTVVQRLCGGRRVALALFSMDCTLKLRQLSLLFGDHCLEPGEERRGEGCAQHITQRNSVSHRPHTRMRLQKHPPQTSTRHEQNKHDTYRSRSAFSAWITLSFPVRSLCMLCRCCESWSTRRRLVARACCSACSTSGAASLPGVSSFEPPPSPALEPSAPVRGGSA